MEYYDFLLRHDLKYFCGLTLFNDDSWFSGLAVQRSPRQGPFPRDAADFLRPLFPHFRRAVQIGLRLDRLSDRMRGLVEALNFMSTGVILVGSDSRVVLMNRAAETIIARVDGLRVIRGYLAADLGPEDRKLKHLLHHAVQTGNGRGLRAGGAMSVSRPSMQRPFSIIVSPLRTHERVNRDRIAAVVLVNDAESKSQPPTEILRTLFDLTAAEARLAQAIAGGTALKAYAEAAGVSINTVRTHLAHIFTKTDTRRQTDLVRLLARAIPRLPP